MSFYHYCPTDALFNIISSREIWMSDLSDVNDPNELKLAPRILEKAVSEIYPNLPIWKEIQQNRRKVYSLSLSKSEDLLSQWRAYAGNGTGFQIEFDLNQLIKFNSHNQQFKHNLKSEMVFYDEEHYRKYVNEKISSVYDKNQYKVTGMLQAVRVYSKAIEIIPILKDKFYSEEQEARLYTIEPDRSLSITSANNESKRFVTRNNKITCYLALKLTDEKTGEHPIKSITIGPNNDIDSYDLTEFLNINGFQNVYIKNSVGLLKGK